VAELSEPELSLEGQIPAHAMNVGDAFTVPKRRNEIIRLNPDLLSSDINLKSVLPESGAFCRRKCESTG